MLIEKTNETKKENTEINEIKHEIEEELSINEDLLDFWKRFCESGDKCNDTCCGLNGVFAPVCTNGVCIIPRPDNSIELAKGYGLIKVKSRKHCGDDEYLVFRLYIKKEYGICSGELTIINHDSRETIFSKDLVSYHTDNDQRFIAVFHIKSMGGTVRELAVFGSEKHPTDCHKPNSVKYSSLYFYSAPYLNEKEISMGGRIIKGSLEIMVESEEDHGMDM